MAITYTTRLGLPQWGAGTDPFTRALMNAAFASLESEGVYFSQGTFATIPAVGKQGRFYWATDLSSLFYDNGTAWVNAGGGSTSKYNQFLFMGA